ncbi:S41 family peptidase [Candidatus Bipolaricaulota bacterium]
MSINKDAYPELTTDLRNRVIEKVVESIREYYVFEDAAHLMADHVVAQHKAEAFHSIGNLPELAAALGRELRSVNEDLHLSVAAWLPPEEDADREADRAYEEWLETMPRKNYEFRKLEILLGNIGYLDLRAFCPANIAGQTATAAMQFLAHTDALIFDLRDNGGGDSLVQYLQSYLFSEPTHMVSQRYRPDRLEQTWTYAYVPGPRFPDTPVYVLMSRSSFSAAEDFAYTLQQQGRITVVGEQTRGGAHPIEFYRFPELCLELTIPNACSEDPISGGNWEESGVIPDVAVPANDALQTAHMLALETLLETDVTDDMSQMWRWALASVRNNQSEIELTQDVLDLYVGQYGNSVVITSSDGALSLCWGGRRDLELTPMGDHRFEFDHGTQRAQFMLENETVQSLVCSSIDGDKWSLPRRETVAPTSG